MVHREIKIEMDNYLNKYPIVVVTGPRQSGKTTFLREEYADYTYVNLENPDTRRFALQDSNGFLAQYSNKIILDEVQQVPQLFSYLQTKVDEDKIMGQYILSGSQNFHLMDNISQSLAGRVAIFKLFPLSVKEMKNENLLEDDFAQQLIKGFYPGMYHRDIKPSPFFSNYVQTYVQRDLNTLLQVKELRAFNNFLRLLAARVGQLVNLNSLANECGITQPTANSWLSVLETSYIIFKLPPFFENFNKRVIKTPKVYFHDTGLLCFLLGIRNPLALHTLPIKGQLFENMVVSEMVKSNHHQFKLRDFYFWRDSNGHEVDLMWEEDYKYHFLEIKATQTLMPDHFKGLNYMDKLVGDRIGNKYLIHTGLYNQDRTQGRVRTWQQLDLI